MQVLVFNRMDEHLESNIQLSQQMPAGEGLYLFRFDVQIYHIFYRFNIFDDNILDTALAF